MRTSGAGILSGGLLAKQDQKIRRFHERRPSDCYTHPSTTTTIQAEVFLFVLSSPFITPIGTIRSARLGQEIAGGCSFGRRSVITKTVFRLAFGIFGSIVIREHRLPVFSVKWSEQVLSRVETYWWDDREGSVVI